MNNTMLRLGLSVTLLAAVAGSVATIAPRAMAGDKAAPATKTEEFASISQADLQKAIDAKTVTIFDVNGDESYKEGRIPTAVNYYAIEKDFAAHLPKDKGALVVAYCGNPHCTAYKQAARAAEKLGYTNVAHFSPGIAGWRASGAKQDKG